MNGQPNPANPIAADGLWSTSSYSAANNECVEVARGTNWVAVRDSKDPGAGMAITSRRAWSQFVESLSPDGV
ncbi:DUF397 domain-containing protein [Streptomyces sp. NPDC054878]